MTSIFRSLNRIICLFRFSDRATLGKNDRTEIWNDWMSRDPIFGERIIIGVERSELRGVTKDMRGLQVKVEKRSRMLLSGFVLVNVQVGRF